MPSESYVYSDDEKFLQFFSRMELLKIPASITLEISRKLLKGILLGRGVKVTAKQFPSVHRAVETCAKRLSISAPDVFIVQEPTLNALTFSSHKRGIIVLNSAAVDHFAPRELLFVIGHECGHIQNNHVLYHTMARWVAFPVAPLLRRWLRFSEITADRAGALACGSLDDSLRALIKLALGAQKLYKDINVDEYMNQLEELKKSYARFLEFFFIHPFLPKRVESIKLFSQSRLFSKQGAKAMTKQELDRRVQKLLGVM